MPDPGAQKGTSEDAATPGNRGQRGIAKGDSFSDRKRTSSFERLVECCRNAHKDLKRQVFFALLLKVAGEGEMSLISYFPIVSTVDPDMPARVIQGGATLESRKDGRGFVLWFIGCLGKGFTFE